MEIWDSGMPPREEAIAAVKELSRPEAGSKDAARRSGLVERIPVVAWMLVATVAAIALAAWFFARA